MSLGRPPSQFEATRRRLRAELDAGRFAPTGLLPGERDLSQQLAVSRTTIRRVVAALVDEGRLAHRQGVGTFVPAKAAGPSASMAPITPPPSILGGFSDAMRRRGLVVTTRLLSRVVVEPSPKEALALACSPRDEVVRLRRLRFIDEDPVRIEENVLPAALSEGIDGLDGSIYAALAQRGIVPCRALHRLRIGAARTAEASQIGCAPGSATLRVDRLDYRDDGRCCLVTTAVTRADQFDLVIDVGVTTSISAL